MKRQPATSHGGGAKRKSRVLTVSNLSEAYTAFMTAPATGGYGTNEGVVLAVMGHESVRDCPTFDEVRRKYDRPDACTFEQAFKACWGGSRNWRDFDLATLKETHSEFRHLQLPSRIEEALSRGEQVEYEKEARMTLEQEQAEEEALEAAAEHDVTRKESSELSAREQKGLLRLARKGEKTLLPDLAQQLERRGLVTVSPGSREWGRSVWTCELTAVGREAAAKAMSGALHREMHRG